MDEKNPKPAIKEPRTTELPMTLIQTAAFCNWQYELQHGKWSKVPINPRTGQHAKANNRDTFGIFDDAVAFMKRKPETGLGVGVFDDLCAIDIDDCVDDQGNLSPLAVDIITSMDAYTEYSPSGNGIRILFTASDFVYDKDKYYIMNSGTSKDGIQLETLNGKQQQLEVYVAGATSKYLTVTGNTLTPGYGLRERKAKLQTILDRYMLRNVKGESSTQKGGSGGTENWQTLLQQALKDDPELRFLYNLEPDQPNRDNSRDDLALLNKLATRLKGDPTAMRKAFQGSPLGQRKKAYREDYLKRTIAKALPAWEESKRKQAEWEANRQQKTIFRQQSNSLLGHDLDRVRNTNTDGGNAIRFCEMFRDDYSFVPEWGWCAWNGKHWETNAKEKPKHAFLKMCNTMMRDALEELKNISSEQKDARAAAEKRYDWAKKTANAARVRDGLNLAQPFLVKEADDFDQNPFDLNTPAGIVDLRTGTIRPHDPKALCTSMTKYAPEKKPHPMWDDFLEYITAGDKDLVEYLQIVAGMAAFGKVFNENVIFAYGTGGNGKSTLFNAIQGVFGTYATTIRPEILMVMKNKSEVSGLAALKGKRYALAAETEEGSRLSSSTMKRMSSTDTINARVLYHEAFDFKPSHTLVLCTNHLPKIGSTDRGTWRRIKLVPFTRCVEQDKPVIPDYAQVLQDAEGGAIMEWVIEGAIKFYEKGFKADEPQAVRDATAEYQEAENWIANFIGECCDVGKGFHEAGGNLYSTYRQWAEDTGEYKRRMNDFAMALEGSGYEKRRTMTGSVWDGIRISQKYKDMKAGFLPVESNLN